MVQRRTSAFRRMTIFVVWKQQSSTWTLMFLVSLLHIFWIRCCISYIVFAIPMSLLQFPCFLLLFHFCWMRIAAIESNRSVTVNRCITVIRGSLVVASLLVLSCFPSAFLAWFLPSPETCQIEFPNQTSHKDTDTQTHKCADTQTHRFIHTKTHRQTDTLNVVVLLCFVLSCCCCSSTSNEGESHTDNSASNVYSSPHGL